MLSIQGPEDNNPMSPYSREHLSSLPTRLFFRSAGRALAAYRVGSSQMEYIGSALPFWNKSLVLQTPDNVEPCRGSGKDHRDEGGTHA